MPTGPRRPGRRGADRRSDRALEQDAHPVLRNAIAHCASIKDYISRELFESILESEEEHIDFLETQLELIERLGMQNYLQSAIAELNSP